MHYYHVAPGGRPNKEQVAYQIVRDNQRLPPEALRNMLVETGEFDWAQTAGYVRAMVRRIEIENELDTLLSELRGLAKKVDNLRSLVMSCRAG